MNSNTDVFSDAADFYDQYRPSPPDELPALLAQLSQVPHPALVVDLGSGTGLSTVPWAGKAAAVLGIEPNPDMLAAARCRVERMAPGAPISFRQAEAHETGLPDECADIVTCAQSFHWMEPQATLAETARILRPGGVFAAYDYAWPPSMNWQAEAAYETFINRAWALIAERGLDQDFHIWQQNRTLAALQACGHFRFVKEVWLHRQELGDAGRFVGLALTNGIIQPLQKGQLSEEELGLARFRQTVQSAMGTRQLPWLFSYHVRVGIR